MKSEKKQTPVKLIEEPKIDMRRLERNLEPELEISMQSMGSNIKSIMSSIVSTPKRHSSSTTSHKSSKSSKKDREHKDHKHSSQKLDSGSSIRKLSHSNSSMSSSTSSIASCSSSDIVKTAEKAPLVQQNLIVEAVQAVKAQEVIEEVIEDPILELLVPDVAAETEIIENYDGNANFPGDSEMMDVALNEEVAENLVIEEMVVDQDGTQIIIQPATKYLQSDEMPKKPSTKSNGSKQKSTNDLLSSIMASMDK